APEHGADEVVQRVLLVVHVTDAGGDRHEGAQDGHEAGEDDRDAAEALEETVGAFDVLAAEQAALLALEHFRAEPVAYQVADFTARECGDADQDAHPPDLEPEDE